MRKPLLLLLCAALLLSGCARRPEEKKPGGGKTVCALGETASTYWFDFQVTGARTEDTYGTFYAAGEGKKLAVCTLELTSTVDEPVPMGWDDFLLRWGEGEETQSAAPLPWAGGDQLPDEFDLEKDRPVSGVLVYEIPAEVDTAALAFRERFNEGESDSLYTEGALFLVQFKL